MPRSMRQQTVGRRTPHAIAKPSISASSWVLAQVATCNDGVWIGEVTITRQWIRDASTVIAGATNAAYTLAAADQTHTVKCRVTATNQFDAVTMDSPSSPTVS